MGQITAVKDRKQPTTKGLTARIALEDFLAEYRGVQGRSDRATSSQRNHLVETLTMVSAVRGAAYDDLDLADVTREDLVKVLVTYRERPDRRFAANPGAAVRERSNAQHALSIWFYAITPLPFLCLRFLGILWHGPERLLAYRLSLSVGIPCFIVLCGVVLVMRSGRYEQERAPLYQGAHDGSQVR